VFAGACFFVDPAKDQESGPRSISVIVAMVVATKIMAMMFIGAIRLVVVRRCGGAVAQRDIRMVLRRIRIGVDHLGLSLGRRAFMGVVGCC